MLRQKLVLVSITLTIALFGVLLTGCGTTGDASTSQPPPPPPPPGSSALTASPTSTDFGSVAVGGMSSRTITLRNTGSGSVSITGANVSGNEFSVSGITFPRTVAAGASTTASVRFSPQSPSSASGSVSFVSDASNSPAVVSLSGSGFTPLAHAVDLNWNASPSVVDGYKVYRSNQSGNGYQVISSALVGGTVFTDANVQSGQTYFYVVTAVGPTGAESSFSNESTATIPVP
ncbi:MAG: choice-of-anchor D domain-containing protein [Acidobacteriales bacterium]|nr:choice-of-anchor D domain-containing protein [Terriglobales bacterium]